LSLYADSSSLSDVTDFVNEWRFNLLDEQTVSELSSPETAEAFAENRLYEIMSPFNLMSLDNIDTDPFLLSSIALMNCEENVLKSGTSMQPKDGVLAAECDGLWYVMINGILSREGASLYSGSAVPLIQEVCASYEKDGVRTVLSGTPFHSWKSSSSASSEISVIGTVSLLVAAVILILVFRSPVPILASVSSILLSVAAAAGAVFVLFGKIHALTLVFGTSLIGSCIDYSLHYFINWKHSRFLKTQAQIRASVFKGLFLSLLSTEICYALLYFAPFELLKQMAVFSFAGILSSFLTVNGPLTFIGIPSEEKRTIRLLEKIDFSFAGNKKRGLVFKCALFVFCVTVIAVKSGSLGIKNDISSLYKMEGRLKEDTVLSYKVLSYSPSSWLIVSAPSCEELLQKEEYLSSFVPDDFVCTSMFVPSFKKQLASINAVKNMDEAVVKNQFELLGFSDEEYEAYRKEVLNAENRLLTPQSPLPSSLSQLVSMLYIGESGGKYYSVILPSKISDAEAYRKLASENEGVFFENKVQDISSSLDRLTSLIFIMFAVSYAVIVLVMKFFYPLKKTLRIASIPLLSVLSIVAVFLLTGNRIEFFCATGMILVFGLGLDYIIYRTEHEHSSAENFAILLSFITTAVSFGALALSSFVPVHVIGLSIFTGLVTAFLCTVL
ncbi:MAG: MMPL family transporter, partial [Treponema sp.]|nr:MMPL family transporter [Treponema sp.]